MVGVLAFQGDFERHRLVIEKRNVETRPIRRPEELEHIDALVIPGGESTTIGMLMERFGLLEPIIRRVRDGSLAIMGTCAGAILLATEIAGSSQTRLGVLDVTVTRNAYGRQIDSFEADVAMPALGSEPLRGVFIRAPRIDRVGPSVEVLARFEDRAVVVRSGSILALTFHPELTGDTRLHDYFLEMAGSGDRESASGGR